MSLPRKIFLTISTSAALILLAGLLTHKSQIWNPAAVVLAVSLALGIRTIPSSRSYQFTLWIVVAVTAAMIYPQRFQHIGSLELRNPWLILFVVQAVMFGMGTQMSLHDLAGVTRAPLGVLVGIGCHFSVMPLVGFGLTRLFHFPPEIAAGIILIGSCSSGLASNVMSYIARANLPLAVTVTAITTLLAPIMTPMWMKFLAGDKVDVQYVKMMLDIITQVLAPIGAALLHDHLKRATSKSRLAIFAIAIIGAAWLIFLASGGWKSITAHTSAMAQAGISALGFILGAAVFGVIYHGLTLLLPRLDKLMPLASMAGIVYFTLVTTAAGRDNLLRVGALLFVASILHNAAGYFFGYFLSRACQLDTDSARSVAFEVGLQNGGMATGLASNMGKLDTVGLAAAIFSPWMNVSGSILANYWRRRPSRQPVATS